MQMVPSLARMTSLRQGGPLVQQHENDAIAPSVYFSTRTAVSSVS